MTRTQYDDRWAPQVTYTENAADPIVEIDWSMKVSQATGKNAFGPFFGIEAYDEMSGKPLRIAAFGVDSNTGELLFIDPSIGGAFNIDANDDTVAFGQYDGRFVSCQSSSSLLQPSVPIGPLTTSTTNRRATSTRGLIRLKRSPITQHDALDDSGR